MEYLIDLGNFNSMVPDSFFIRVGSVTLLISILQVSQPRLPENIEYVNRQGGQEWGLGSNTPL